MGAAGAIDVVTDRLPLTNEPARRRPTKRSCFSCLTFLRDLMAHAEWANAVFFHAWGQSPARDHEELRRRLDHLIGVQQGFLSILARRAARRTRERAAVDLRRSEGSRPNLPRRPARLRGEPGRRRRCRGRCGSPGFRTRPVSSRSAEAMVQVAMHSQHHRGQCMTRLKDFGGEPKNVDWIIWLWKQKPAARWS